MNLKVNLWASYVLTDVGSTEKSVKIRFDYISGAVNVGDASRFRSSRRSHPVVFLEKGVLKICSKFTGEHP